MKQKFYPKGVILSIFLFPLTVLSQQFSLLKDVNPGVNGSIFLSPANINGVLFFRPNDGIHGDELWKTNGTEAGTVMIKDINPGANGSDLQLFTNINGVLFFSADDGIHGTELWKSDGTEEGTVMVKDINIGDGSTTLSSLTNINGLLYFNARNSNGSELWKSNGTEAGTIMIKDIHPGVATSGPGAGTPHSGNPFGFTLFNGLVYFSASDATGRKLWQTNGTEAGTVQVKGGFFVSSYTLNKFIVVNGVLYFSVYNGSAFLWKSDGTEAGTVFIKETGGYDFAITPVVLNNTLYFLDRGLWKSDGTDAGTYRLKNRDYGFSYSPEMLISINGLLYFTGYDATNGWELWKSDGTIAGTVLLKDIKPGIGNSNIKALTKIGNKLMFTADDGVHGNEIWTSDGTPEGTKLVQDIEPGAAGSQQPSTYEIKGSLVEASGKIYTAAATGPFGTELWVAAVVSEIGLPLKFLEFKGSIVNNDGQLQWKTDNETNTDAFIVERSINGSNYKSIGSVAAANTPGIHQYNFTDADIVSLGAPVIHYRLKQTDIDGRSTYSNIVSLAIDNSNSFVMLYPNPVKNKISLTINVSQKEKMLWQLVDNTGRTVKRGMYDLSAGSTAVSIDIPGLSSGIYFMQLNGTTLQKIIKVIKQ